MSSLRGVGLYNLTLKITALCLILSGIVVINIGFNVRPIHLLLPWLVLVMITGYQRLWGKFLSFFKAPGFYILIVYLVFLLIGVNSEESSRLFMGIIFNLVLGLLFYVMLTSGSVKDSFYLQLSYYSILFLSLVILIQFFLSLLGLYQPHMYGKDGFFLLGRPAAFFGDPGWLAYWLILFGILVYYFRKTNRIGGVSFYVFIFTLTAAILINQSRVTLFFLGLNYFIVILKNKRERKFFLLALIAFSGIAFSIFLYMGWISIPQNLYYDIINLNANPRFYDAQLILKEFNNSGNIWFGNGLGSLERLGEIYPWREFTNAHNVLPLQVINDSGITGLVLLLLLVVFLYKKLQGKIAKMMYVEFIVLLSFHNIFPYFQLFWFLLPLIFAFDSVDERELHS